MPEIDARVRGRVNLVAGANSLYPKFIVQSEEPFEYTVITSASELSNFPDSQEIFEPVTAGFGSTHRVLYVPTMRKTYLFLIPTSEIGTSWGSESIRFLDNLTFND